MTVKAKIRLMEVGRQYATWTEAIAKDDEQWWRGWFDTLTQLNYIEVPRCLFPNEDAIALIELHTFVEASEEAFSVVTYTRSVYKDGSILIRHVKAATKLSPTKSLSIPKLELGGRGGVKNYCIYVLLKNYCIYVKSIGR